MLALRSGQIHRKLVGRPAFIAFVISSSHLLLPLVMHSPPPVEGLGWVAGTKNDIAEILSAARRNHAYKTFSISFSILPTPTPPGEGMCSPSGADRDTEYLSAARRNPAYNIVSISFSILPTPTPPGEGMCWPSGADRYTEK